VPYRGPLPERAVDRINSFVVGLRASPRWGPLVSRHLTVVTYQGRRSGRTFRTPVYFRRAGDRVTIDVRRPDTKAWWRNFSGGGGPMSLQLDGVDRTGHAVARRVDAGRVTVTVSLDG
jgi:hypothetical protein